VLQPLSVLTWDQAFSVEEAIMHTSAIENGEILYLPQLSFVLRPEEQVLLSQTLLDRHSKNVSFNPMTGRVKGANGMVDEKILTLFMQRFFETSQIFVEVLLPHYRGFLSMGRTSFRPAEIAGRKTSPLKDDARLHVDAFSATPNQGKRILRIFCNVNPNGVSRLWQTGEPFKKMVEQFVSLLRPPLWGSRRALALLKITKSYRTLYDHYMLMLHDQMKMNRTYQNTVQKTSLSFAADSTWVVMTDSVSHAALSGQYVLEQTFYLPPEKMLNPEKSPLFILEKALNKKLI
jgi:hypothetical protein